MSQHRMLLAVERIADDRRFAARFRRDPEGALRRYRLTTDQIAAIKAGDAASLVSHGIDVVRFSQGRRHGVRRLMRRSTAAAAIVAGFVGMSATPANAIRIMGARMDGIWSLGHASDKSGQESLADPARDVEVPTSDVPGQGRPFHLD